ncbi:glyoxylase-like metal-dependent hydrolase (beta-lactamase superfamily II) [Cytobacillus firmus]|uniref:Glyoxylase-like metal-dependent hydrolase (Beta-lactamase superfamily II) n=2 Tax=Cytobacillus TaxID=2675230 RepID=A0A366JS62_CYTFI|nr:MULTISPECIES: MBL fold metallo-hydrolase [Cytobacillus]RBP90685.1 glyoxylase-like metal-dependent hydrolase (beta-lactamase superfamily II) [Cytobacillus firmus]TDX46267.1 glyoxylase-like metal-dependent hydrolase (beta-lactamase superfamily II) [Cytobacillus oceanisediminis]
MEKIVPLTLESPFSEGIVMVYAVLGDSATLIDTGSPGEKSFFQLRSQLKKHGIKFQDFDRIVLTHMHTDHSGGVSLIQQESGLPVYVHEEAKRVITEGEAEFKRINLFFNKFIEQCGADHMLHQHNRKYKEEIWTDVYYLRDGDEIHIGGKPYYVMHVPGHSQTDILLWNVESGTAFVGDHLIEEISVNAFVEPPPPDERQRPEPLIQYRESLDRVKILPLQTCFSGHGKPFNQHNRVIDIRLAEHESRCRQIHHLLKDGKKNVFELCQGLYPRLKGKTVFLGLSQIQGHLDLMEQRQEVERKDTEKVYYYQLK